MPTRQYSSRSQQSTLTTAITAGTTSITVVSGSALLGGVTIPAGRTFTLVIDPDTAIEEIVDATSVSTHTFTITRAIDGSSAQEHSAGAVVRHMAIGRDYRDANLHTQASASYNDGAGNAQSMHGIASGEGSVVGTDKAQTLTNKILTSPTISDPTLTGTASAGAVLVFEGTTADTFETTLTVVDPTQDNTITLPNTSGTVTILDAAQTLSNKTLTSPIISGSPVITGLSSAGMVSTSATPKDYVDAILGSATAAATSAASAATSAASAATSATSASNSASAASTSATSAAASATAASTSASSAATSATAAATSATSAAASVSAVETSAASAATSASSASTSASSALTSANSASASASAAATSATSAAASTSAAAISASSAAASATAASTSASSASTSASSALTSANSAAVSAASAAAAVTTAIQASIIDAKGDLIVGSAADTAARLGVGTDGYILTASSTATNGLTWSAAPSGYLAPTIGTTVVTSGTTVSTITAVTLDNATLTGTLTASATSGTNGYLLTSTGTGVQWAAAPVSLPSQTGNDGKLLTTNGTTASWAGAAPVAQTTEPTTLIDGLIWVDTDGAVVGQAVVRWSKAPTGGTTLLSGLDDSSVTLSYTAGYEQVYRNGTLLSRGNDYTATNGTSITLIDATLTGDIIEVIGSAVLAIADVYTQAQVNSGFIPQTTNLFAGKNKIINGNFAINQRNFTSNTTNGAYNFDRFLQANSGGTTTVTPQTFTAGAAPVAGYEAKNFVRIVTASQSAAGDYALYGQKIEDVRTLAGQTATVSFWAKASTGTPKIGVTLDQYFGTGGSASPTVVNTVATQTITTSWVRYSFTITVPSISGAAIGTDNNSSLSLYIVTSTGATLVAAGYPNTGIQNATIDIWGVQVEAGSTATAFQTATGTLQGELAACQRYYEKSGVFTGTPGAAASLGEMWFPNATIANNETWQSPRFAVTKRSSPSVTTYSYNGTSSRAANDSGTDYGADSANVWRANETGFVIKNNSGSSMTVTSVRWVYCNWAASAEL